MDVFTEFPARTYESLIVRYPTATTRAPSVCVADAADRLASSYRGGAPGDAVLLPFLTCIGTPSSST